MTNNQQHRFTLDGRNVTGRRQQKGTCPQCGRKSLVRYVDTQRGCEYLNDMVGRCDHEQSCGYHYRPSDYFHDHLWPHQQLVTPPPKPVVVPKEMSLRPLDMSLVLSSQSPRSTFWQWFATTAASRLETSEDDVQRVFQQYHIGATRQGDVIFWQIDHQGLVHTGHIMGYHPNGHRSGSQSWTHYRLQKKGLLTLDYQPPKCFFGEHLLPLHSHATVCIVESEKTALIMAAHQPQHLWLATAGCGGLTLEKTRCLQGRRVRLFPDSGCYQKWLHQMQFTTDIDYHVSPDLEAFPPNTDLADIILQPP